MSIPHIQVSETAAQASARAEREKLGKPSHWVHSTPTQFQNPWTSWRQSWGKASDMLEVMPQALKFLGPSKESIAQIPIQKPTWGLEAKEVVENAQKIKATWLGHACFLVELPSTVAGVRGARILFDPVFSDRCSPSQWVGPKRFTPPPCTLEDVPEIDAIVISHNHYDHMDTTSLKNLLARTPAPHVFAPIGNAPYFKSLNVPASRAHCIDWWDARRVTAHVSPTQTVSFDITFTPGQHFTGRGILDRFKTLWGGWVVEGVQTDGEAAPGARVYFGGDTGYRSVPSSTDDGPETLPVCPAFKEIGERWGAFDLALIPIGAYAPRHFMSPIHCAPRDSVGIFRDIRARRALGMHWGAWVLTSEDVNEPPALLAEECAKAGVKEGAFGVCGIGETVVVDVGEGA
ncbi:N-acyl-phosphatidylethanolamine-hydrolyzing phospholipase D [Mycena metata]|uniref:N-acyl-phosphatidylethanolamine-hydrolyzing phospholipase D n=1 Tax=Mycena metata TaxID=1033252 RepID=A0AAD7JG16_9AGAR|nr:N-acyl-phosphatidylethanolamine-hydrolyzing phospholipase D [Mycena metata]